MTLTDDLLDEQALDVEANGGSAEDVGHLLPHGVREQRGVVQCIRQQRSCSTTPL